jgi:EVH1-like domain in PP4R3 protein
MADDEVEGLLARVDEAPASESSEDAQERQDTEETKEATLEEKPAEEEGENDPQKRLRVKVYVLDASENWEDLGTGTVSIELVERLGTLALVVLREQQPAQPEEPGAEEVPQLAAGDGERVMAAEDSALVDDTSGEVTLPEMPAEAAEAAETTPATQSATTTTTTTETTTETTPSGEPAPLAAAEVLLCEKLYRDDIYQVQADTLIVWNDPETDADLALSFQQSAGCHDIWVQIYELQQAFAAGEGNVKLASAADLIPNGTTVTQPTIESDFGEIYELPEVSADTVKALYDTFHGLVGAQTDGPGLFWMFLRGFLGVFGVFGLTFFQRVLFSLLV